MAIERFIDELGTDLNKYTLTYVSNGNRVDVRLVRKATITQVGTLLNASKLNELVDAININSAKQITFNGLVNNAPTFFAPTSAGTNGYVLKSNGSGEPTWVSQSDLTAGKDSEGNVIKDTYLKKSGGVMSGDLDMGSMDIINVANIEVGQDIVVESDSTNAKMNNQGFYAEDKEGNYFVKLDSHKLNFNNGCNVDEHGINNAYGGLVFNDANEPTLLNKVGRFISIATDSWDGDYIYYYFPEKEGTVALTSDLPTKLSELTNDNNNVYMNKRSWTITTKLPSTGLYMIKVNDSSIGGNNFNLGLFYFILGGGTEVIGTFYHYGIGFKHYYATADSNGTLNLYLQNGDASERITSANFYYIKLS